MFSLFIFHYIISVQDVVQYDRIRINRNVLHELTTMKINLSVFWRCDGSKSLVEAFE